MKILKKIFLLEWKNICNNYCDKSLTKSHKITRKNLHNNWHRLKSKPGPGPWVLEKTNLLEKVPYRKAGPQGLK